MRTVAIILLIFITLVLSTGCSKTESEITKSEISGILMDELKEVDYDCSSTKCEWELIIPLSEKTENGMTKTSSSEFNMIYDYSDQQT